MARMPRMRIWLWSTLHRWFPTSAADAYCSFCGRGHNEAGPFLEGMVGTMICEQCVRTSVALLDARKANGNRSVEVVEQPKPFDHHGFMSRVLMVNLIVFIIVVAVAAGWFAYRSP